MIVKIGNENIPFGDLNKILRKMGWTPKFILHVIVLLFLSQITEQSI